MAENEQFFRIVVDYQSGLDALKKVEDALKDVKDRQKELIDEMKKGIPLKRNTELKCRI